MSQVIDGYDAILVRGAPRYRHNRKMVAAAQVPKNIREALNYELQNPQPEVLQSPAEIQASREARPIEAGVQAIEEKEPYMVLANELGSGVEYPRGVVHPAGSIIQLSLSEVEQFRPGILHKIGEVVPILKESDFTEPAQPAQLNRIPDTVTDESANSAMPTAYEMKLIEELEAAKAKIVELSTYDPTPGVETASIFELAREMYKRFSVYTVFVGDVPKDDDVHPFHGGTMTRYELGLAYQMFNRVQAQGLLNRDFEGQAERVQQGRDASAVHLEEMRQRAADPHFQAPSYATFSERTSVEGQNKQASTTTVTRNGDQISDEMTAEPNLRGQTVRPQW